MHGTNWGGHPHRRYKGAGMEIDLPLVSAPMAGIAVLVGMMLGMLIGYKKARIVQAHRGMMGGMGHGMMGSGMGGYGGGMMGGKHAMMQMMAAHHHHGYGDMPCWCDECDYDEMAEEEEDETAG